ncbi:MAG: hypothetical protein ACHQM4_12480 [Thermoanaerobaculia bacterium]
MTSAAAVAAAGAAAGVLLLATGTFVLATRLVAKRRGRIFLEGLGGVVRIGTSCLLASGRALVPGTVALTPAGLVWQALLSAPGTFTFEEIQRIETDDRTQARRGFFRSKVLRVTATSGEVKEFVLSPGHAWEWRQALGEWTASRGRIAGARG